MSSALMQLDQVTKDFRGSGRHRGPVRAVDGLTMTVATNEIVALVGESGAGKSTVGRLILGLEHPTSGSVRFDGVDLATLSRREMYAARRRMHLIAQDPYQSLHPGMTLGQIVAEPLAIRGLTGSTRDEKVERALDEVGLTPVRQFVKRYPHELSGGQRQRVALARALVSEPDLVIADEPTSMLDASLCANILEHVLGMRDRLETAFVYVTHTLAVARYVADRIVVMHEGRAVEVGDADRVIEAPEHPYTKLLIAASEGDLDEMKIRRREFDEYQTNQEETCPTANA